MALSPIDPNAAGIAQTIQLAFAPALLLSVVGVLLGVLTNRLTSALQRARKLEEPASAGVGTDLRERQEQLRVLVRRIRLLNRGITLMVICGLLIAVVVVAIFLNTFVAADFSRLIAILFMVAMLSLIASLITLLREIFLAISALRIGPKD